MSAKYIGIIDSGFSAHQESWVSISRHFGLDARENLFTAPCSPDSTGHGSAVIDIIRSHTAMTRFAVAQVFSTTNRTSIPQVVAAVEWLVKQRVELINMSLGLRNSRSELHEVCRWARKQGVLLVASSPAMGPPVYPAYYPEVIAVTSDGRCITQDQCNPLTDNNAQFGAYGYGPGGQIGSSMACAHFSGLWAYHNR